MNLLFSLFVLYFSDALECNTHYYTKCQIGASKHCKAGYELNQYHIRWNCFPGFFSSRCDAIPWTCGEDEYCGDFNECNINAECNEATSDVENWVVRRIDWFLDEGSVEHMDPVSLPSFTYTQVSNSSSETHVVVSSQYSESRTVEFQNRDLPTHGGSRTTISNGLNWTSTVPVFARHFTESDSYSHTWGRYLRDKTPLRNTTFVCEGQGEAVECSIWAKQVRMNVSFEMHLHHKTNGIDCLSRGVWTGIGLYDPYSQVYSTSEIKEDDDGKASPFEMLIDLPWWLLIIIFMAVAICLITMIAVACTLCSSEKELEPVQLMNPIVSDEHDVPNFVNRAGATSRVTSNYALLS